MTEFETIEDHIKAEYSKLDAYIALHPKMSVLIAAVGFYLLGHIV